MTKELYSKFVGLWCSLSPENLSCDGECSRFEISRRYDAIMREWKELERQAGRTVTQEEIERYAIREL